MEFLKVHPEGVTLTLRLQPRASRVGLQGAHGSVLKWGVSSPPLEGRANQEVLRAVADFFDLPLSAVSLLRGEKNREKVLLLKGLSLAVAASRLT